MSLYLHTRQNASAVQVRQHFLTLRPQIRSSWVGLMVAHHLNGDIPSAIETYEALQSCINVDGGTAPERAQTALYVIRLCVEQGDYENALKRLDTGLSKKVINARGEISHMRGTSRLCSRDYALTHISRHAAQAGSKR
jgi:DNA-binding SARP family transcriptional activator